MGEAEPDIEGRRIAAEARDRVRFEEEALALADQVYRVARRLVGTREEAEDLVQDTYGRAFRSWRSYTPGTNLRAWLLRILTNLNLDRGRKVQRTPDMQPIEEGDYYLANRMVESQGEQVLDQDRVVEKLSQDSIVTALSSLPHDFRDTVVLVDIGEFSYADAAQILDIPIGTVMSRLHRGRRLLKQKLAEEAIREPRALRRCEELLQGYLDRQLTDAEVAPGGVAPRRLRLLPAAVSLRGIAAPIRADDRSRADADRPDGEVAAARSADAVAPTRLAQPVRQVGRGVHVPWITEVVAGNESHVELAQPRVGDPVPRLPGYEQRVTALTSVRRSHEAAPFGPPGVDDALDGGGGEIRPVGEHDDRRLVLGAELLETARERRTRATLPSRTGDDPSGRLERVRPGYHDDLGDGG